MDAEKIVKDACAHATLQFQKQVDEYQESPPITDEKEFWYIRRMRGIEKAIPDMLETALSLALTELLEKLEESR